MFEIELESAERIVLRGTFDAAQEERARQVLDQLTGSCTLDLQELTFISSAGLGLLVALQLRLSKRGGAVTLVNLRAYVRELLQLSGLEEVFLVS